jgi:hypothetical protein
MARSCHGRTGHERGLSGPRLPGRGSLQRHASPSPARPASPRPRRPRCWHLRQRRRGRLSTFAWGTRPRRHSPLILVPPTASQRLDERQRGTMNRQLYGLGPLVRPVGGAAPRPPRRPVTVARRDRRPPVAGAVEEPREPGFLGHNRMGPEKQQLPGVSGVAGHPLALTRRLGQASGVPGTPRRPRTRDRQIWAGVRSSGPVEESRHEGSGSAARRACLGS